MIQQKCQGSRYICILSQLVSLFFIPREILARQRRIRLRAQEKLCLDRMCSMTDSALYLDQNEFFEVSQNFAMAKATFASLDTRYSILLQNGNTSQKEIDGIVMSLHDVMATMTTLHKQMTNLDRAIAKRGLQAQALRRKAALLAELVETDSM
jgi:hypothetical protein